MRPLLWLAPLLLLTGCTQPTPDKTVSASTTETKPDPEKQIWEIIDRWLSDMQRDRKDGMNAFYFWTDTLDHYTPPHLNAIRNWEHVSLQHSNGPKQNLGEKTEDVATATVRVEYSRKDGTPIVDNVRFQMRKYDYLWKIDRATAAQ